MFVPPWHKFKYLNSLHHILTHTPFLLCHCHTCFSQKQNHSMTPLHDQVSNVMPLHINLSHDSTQLPDSCTICYMMILPEVFPPNKTPKFLLAQKLKARNLYLLNMPCVHAYMCVCVCVCVCLNIYIYGPWSA
jgi:hypothetical protein